MSAEEIKEPLVLAPEDEPLDDDHVEEDDDMFESLENLTGDRLLSRALRILDKVCHPYWKANHEAMRLQKWHKLITKCALWTATGAVVLAILQLPGLHNEGFSEKILPIIEGIAALAAVVFVTWGIRLAVQKEWLLERHKAESFRILKYQSLLSLVTNPKDDLGLEGWARSASLQAKKIIKLKESDMERRCMEYSSSVRRKDSLHPAVDERDFREILAHYKEKRLDPQVAYFSRKSGEMQRGDSNTKLLPPLLFLLSLAAALLHFGTDIFVKAWNYFRHQNQTWGEGAAIYLITIAALFPVVSSAIRTHRLAHEYSRNYIRFQAKYFRLREVADAFPDMPDNIVRLKRLWDMEDELEEEHYQWLLLMLDAEWYG
jgi:hypothetical protein